MHSTAVYNQIQDICQHRDVAGVLKEKAYLHLECNCVSKGLRERKAGIVLHLLNFMEKSYTFEFTGLATHMLVAASTDSPEIEGLARCWLIAMSIFFCLPLAEVKSMSFTGSYGISRWKLGTTHGISAAMSSHLSW